MLASSLLLCLLGLLPLSALAVMDTRMGNQTIERTINLRTHSIYAPYIDEDLQNRWWDFGADAYINTNKHIRLTRNRPSQIGWLWTRVPLTAQNFIIEVEFKIGGESSHLYGDGMALWLTTTRAQPGPVFGSVDITDNFEGLGIFLDTYANTRHSYSFPRVVGMLGDGKTKYDQEGDGQKDGLGGCSHQANYRRTNVATKLRVSYIKDKYLNVKIQYRAWDDWVNCFTVHDISLPSSPYLGLTAMTGDVSDNHDVISVTTLSAILSPPNLQRDQINSRSGRTPAWIWTFFKFAGVLAVIAGVLYAYKKYVLSHPSDRSFGNAFMGRAGNMGFGGGFYSDAKRF
ncbi:concanavalin A-like lectin/glucanase [Laetiporus sulphureus 93-53]|uniref:Concanavalin A-like lectin/glucanase n=1 Tax=Laetiporus sulphureus 93-53 TaxID=1314785 RepID=A0A165DQJ5_9APHY|nr:concanavalin A-like lectin/glucanase [Laetiporus sulphureus 93-53]KZT05407.1 concanavalin A-like lectin/glucanase [Laetiporus sulphureus 93-53]